MPRSSAFAAATLDKLVAREITLDQAMLSLGVGKRQIYRLLDRFRSHGQDGLVSRHKGRPGPRLFDEPTIFRVMDLICKTYHDFGPTFASQKLLERDGIKVSRETLRQWMIGRGIWSDRAARQPRIHQMRDRRDRRGELVQIDGSPHAWLEDRSHKASLLVFIDDATSELMHLQFAPSETSLAYMEAATAYFAKHGKPLAFYSDKHSIFRNAKANPESGDGMTQFGRALDEIGISMICASSPQAKGRVERANRTLQDRLIKEMRLAGINNYDAAQLFLPSYLADHNSRFAVAPHSPLDAHRPMAPGERLHDLMVWREQRRLTSSLALHYNKVMFILEPSDVARKLIGTKLDVVDYPDGRVEIQHEGKVLPYRIYDKLRRVNQAEVADSKRLDAAFDLARLIQAQNPHQRKRNTAAPIRHSQTGHMFPEFELTPRGKPIEPGVRPKLRGGQPRSPRPAFWDK